MFFIIIFFIIVFFIFISIVSLKVSKDETFDAYKRRRPDLVRNGSVKCAKCGGTSIWMKQVARSVFGTKYAHTCRNCGTKLYYSNS